MKFNLVAVSIVILFFSCHPNPDNAKQSTEKQLDSLALNLDSSVDQLNQKSDSIINLLNDEGLTENQQSNPSEAVGLNVSESISGKPQKASVIIQDELPAESKTIKSTLKAQKEKLYPDKKQPVYNKGNTDGASKGPGQGPRGRMLYEDYDGRGSGNGSPSGKGALSGWIGYGSTVAVKGLNGCLLMDMRDFRPSTTQTGNIALDVCIDSLAKITSVEPSVFKLDNMISDPELVKQATKSAYTMKFICQFKGNTCGTVLFQLKE